MARRAASVSPALARAARRTAPGHADASRPAARLLRATGGLARPPRRRRVAPGRGRGEARDWGGGGARAWKTSHQVRLLVTLTSSSSSSRSSPSTSAGEPGWRPASGVRSLRLSAWRASKNCTALTTYAAHSADSAVNSSVKPTVSTQPPSCAARTRGASVGGGATARAKARAVDKRGVAEPLRRAARAWNAIGSASMPGPGAAATQRRESGTRAAQRGGEAGRTHAARAASPCKPRAQPHGGRTRLRSHC